MLSDIIHSETSLYTSVIQVLEKGYYNGIKALRIIVVHAIDE